MIRRRADEQLTARKSGVASVVPMIVAVEMTPTPQWMVERAYPSNRLDDCGLVRTKIQSRHE
jgi:hypothetical protein